MAPLVYKRFRQLPCPEGFTGQSRVLCCGQRRMSSATARRGVTFDIGMMGYVRLLFPSIAISGAFREVRDWKGRSGPAGTTPGPGQKGGPSEEVTAAGPSEEVTAAGSSCSASRPRPPVPPRGQSGWGFLTLMNRADGTCSGGLSISVLDQHRVKDVNVRSRPLHSWASELSQGM